MTLKRTLFLSASLLTIILLLLIVLDSTRVMHNVAYNHLYDSRIIYKVGRVPTTTEAIAYAPMTPIPYIWAAILIMVPHLSFREVNILSIMLLISVPYMLLSSLSRSKEVRYAKHAIPLDVLLMLGIAFWSLYPPVVYEVGFHHQWYGVLIFSIAVYVLTKTFIKSQAYANWRIIPVVALLSFTLSNTHPFSAVVYLSLIFALVLLLFLQRNMFRVANASSIDMHKVLLIGVTVIATMLYNEILMTQVKRDYVPLLWRIYLMEELQRYLGIVIPSPTTKLTTVLNSMLFKIFIIINLIYPVLVFLWRSFSRKTGKEGALTLELMSSGLALSLIVYVIPGSTLQRLSFTFAERWLWHMLPLIIINNVMLTSAAGISSNFKRHNFIVAVLLLMLALLGLPLTVYELPQRVPLLDVHDIFGEYTVSINKFLLSYLIDGRHSYTPSYYFMHEYYEGRNINMLLVILYTFRNVEDVREALRSTDIVIIGRGLAIYLKAAGFNETSIEDTLVSLPKERLVVYDSKTLKLALKREKAS